MDIKSILICPKCKCALGTELKCRICGAQYEMYHGVYDIINPEMSADQKILWQITDEDIMNLTENGASAGDAEKNEWRRDYFNHINEETKAAQRKLDEITMSRLAEMRGDVCDLATGMGGMLSRILDTKNENITITCTDISKRVLAQTRLEKATDDDKVFYVAADGRYMSVADNSFDYITSNSGFGNIPESEKTAKELFRILKPGGRLIIQGSYIEKDSKSYEICREYGIEKGMVEELLAETLREAGFSDVISTVAGEAVWSLNPYDLVPAAGDNQRFCLIEAVKA